MAGDDAGPSHPAPDRVLDVRGLNCPLPLLRARIVLGEMSPGEHLRVDATDQHSVIDFEAFCARDGHQLLHHTHRDGVYTLLLRRR